MVDTDAQINHRIAERFKVALTEFLIAAMATTNMSAAAVLRIWVYCARSGRGLWSPRHVPTNGGLAASMPSLSSSPWMRVAPHSWLAMLICRIRSRISVLVLGRPRRRRDLDRHRQ
jgi:hypothetical protein